MLFRIKLFKLVLQGLRLTWEIFEPKWWSSIWSTAVVMDILSHDRMIFFNIGASRLFRFLWLWLQSRYQIIRLLGFWNDSSCSVRNGSPGFSNGIMFLNFWNFMSKKIGSLSSSSNEWGFKNFATVKQLVRH